MPAKKKNEPTPWLNKWGRGFHPLVTFVMVRTLGRRRVSAWVVLLVGLILIGPSAAKVHADSSEAVSLTDGLAKGSATAHLSTIESDAFSNATGVVRANLTAGDGNVQQNSTAFAASNGVSVAGLRANQLSDTATSDFYQVLSARIEAGAFDGTTGVSMVNQSAGAGNVQFNGAAIAIGGLGSAAFIQLNNESLSSQSAATGSASGTDGKPFNLKTETSVDPGAFQNARGVIMINQAAGNNNATANSFTLSVGQ